MRSLLRACLNSPSCLDIIARLPTTRTRPFAVNHWTKRKIVLWTGAYIYNKVDFSEIDDGAYHWRNRSFDFYQCLRDLKERDKSNT